jgi:hypothetical protein
MVKCHLRIRFLFGVQIRFAFIAFEESCRRLD